MWLAQKASEQRGEDLMAVGTVTIGGSPVSVYTDGETRNLSVASPGGYFWKPVVGDSVLIVKCADGEWLAQSRVGAEAPAGLAGGEVLIKSAGGASVLLKNDGTVAVTGDLTVSGRLAVDGSVDIKGSLTVGGRPYAPCSCS